MVSLKRTSAERDEMARDLGYANATSLQEAHRALAANALHPKHCVCARCTLAAETPLSSVEFRLSKLAGAAVRVRLPGPSTLRSGLHLEGNVKELARLCGFKHENGRCYFTGPKILWLLSRPVTP